MLIAPALGVDSDWLYRFVEGVARHALRINRVQFDRLRDGLERERQISGVRLPRLTVGFRRVDLAGSFKRDAKPMRGL